MSSIFKRPGDYAMALIRSKTPEQTWRLSLAFWCLNPAVIFQPMAEKARAVILTSGTLSPLESFAGELQTVFDMKISANHVISNQQVTLRLFLLNCRFALASSPKDPPPPCNYLVPKLTM